MALAVGTSASEAARQTGISLSTVNRRLADPDFRRFVAQLRGQMLERALGRVTDSMSKAADTLAGQLDASEPAIRIRAARALLSLGLRLHDAVDIVERIRQVEEELARYRQSPS